MVIHSLLYQLSLGDTTVGFLRKIDKRLRAAVRKWCDLPYDCPNSYIHASINNRRRLWHNVIEMATTVG